MLNLVGITYYGSISKCERLLPFLFKKTKQNKKNTMSPKNARQQARKVREHTAKHGRAYMPQACR